MSEEQRNHFNRLYEGTTQVIKKLCNPGPYQEGMFPKSVVMFAVELLETA
jgi:hypothetical protein